MNITKIISFPYTIIEYFIHASFIRNKNLSESDKIFTHLTTTEKRKLYNLSREKKEGVLIEIGSFIGASTNFIGAALNHNGKLICIDTWENDGMAEGKKNTWEEFCHNTSNISNNIICFKDYSYNVIDDVKNSFDEIDMLFIDGDHSFEGCKRDFDLYFPLLKKGGIIILHDTGWAEGVQKVMKEDVIPKTFKHDNLQNMFWAWKK